MLYIIKELSLDKTGRILLTDYFEGKAPKDISLGYDPTKKEIIVKPYNKDPTLLHRKVDSKNRLSLPKWLIGILGRDYYFAVDETGRRIIKSKKIS